MLRSTFAPNPAAVDPDKAVAYIDEFFKDRGKITAVDLDEFVDNTGYFKLKTERKTSSLRLDMNADESISGFVVIDYPPPIAVPARNSMPFRLPFRERWHVTSGGRTAEQNHHLALGGSDQFAVDFALRDDEGQGFQGEGLANEDYFTFGKEVLAVAPGRVALVINGLPDNPPASTTGSPTAATWSSSSTRSASFQHLRPPQA